MRKITKIILHCSASPNPNQTIEDIRRWHIAPPPYGNGWEDVGYHAFICQDGLLQMGRPEWKIGAHCHGHNEDSLGLCFAGLDRFTQEQFATAKELFRAWKFRYKAAKVHAHNEFSTKRCPVFDISDLRDFWNALR